jgi:hypothetical protein
VRLITDASAYVAERLGRLVEQFRRVERSLGLPRKKMLAAWSSVITSDWLPH